MSKRILVIDDNVGILEAIKFMLESEDYSVQTSPDDTVIKKIDQKLPNIILLDYLLSGKNGCEVAAELKSNEKTKSIPIIMISAHPSAKENAALVGINGFLAKPFEMEELFAIIAKHIA